MALFLNGRVIEYTNEVIYETDFLRSNLYNMVGVAKLAETILGSGINNATLVYGLPCTPASTPGLEVTIGVGSIYTFTSLDQTAYGVLPADTNPNHRLYKQGVNFDPIDLVTPAPMVAGHSVIHLVQAILQDTDENIVSRPYFNPASTPQNPLPPIDASMPDTRACLATLALKQGIEGVTPTAPTPDPGYTALYYVEVAYGQTVIISNNISKASTVEGLPFITESLTQKASIPKLQSSSYISAIDASITPNQVVVTPANPYASYGFGSTIKVLIANTNTGPSTLNISGQGNANIKVNTPLGLYDLEGGELVTGMIAEFFHNGSTFQLMNPAVPTAIISSVSNIASQTITAGATTKILYNDPIFDRFEFFSANRITPKPVGFFSVTASVKIQQAAYTEPFQLLSYKNGTLNTQIAEQASITQFMVDGSYIVNMNGSTDYLEIFVKNNNAISAVIEPGGFFEVNYIGR